MIHSIQLDGKSIEVHLSGTALQALEQRQQSLVAEIELYFSCLIRKKVRFYDNDPTESATTVTDRLKIRFRPIMTAHCGRDYNGDEPPTTDFPIVDASRFVPKHLYIDHQHQQWLGGFDWSE